MIKYNYDNYIIDTANTYALVLHLHGYDQIFAINNFLVDSYNKLHTC